MEEEKIVKMCEADVKLLLHILSNENEGWCNVVAVLYVRALIGS